MKILEENDKVTIYGVSDFNIMQTMECGQCFNFKKIDDNEYIIVAFKKLIHVRQYENNLSFINDLEISDKINSENCVTTINDIKEIWIPYFDLERDYKIIKTTLIKTDDRFENVTKDKYGIKILNQDFYEMVISFIISQQQNIPRIKKMIRTISERYGEPLGSAFGNVYYSFPSIQRLKLISEEEFKECRTGYRAPYLVDAVRWLQRIDKKYFENMNYNEAKNEMIKIKGVGNKVADCILLFGLGYRNAFPVDVWIKRVMELLYKEEIEAFGSGKIDEKNIRSFAENKFGEYSGYAQQYLFYYGRDHKMGK